MDLYFRLISEPEIAIICSWVNNPDELFYFFPKANFPLTTEQLAGAIAQRTFSTVAVLDNQVIAFANFYQWQMHGACAIGNVIVSPNFRQQGVARSLINHMCELAFKHYMATEVTISCFNHNTAGLLLYPQLGFQPFAVEARTDKLGHPVALIHMRLVSAIGQNQ